jgi:hypothetical protein
MSVSEKEQKSELVPQHKRLAAGAKIDGQSLKSKGESNEKRSGGLAGAKKK